MIRMLILDFDGVLTDNRVLVTEDGHEAAFCTRADGVLFPALRKQGVEIGILSGESNPICECRAEKLHIKCVHRSAEDYANGVPFSKPDAMRKWAAASQVDLEEVAYVGNDKGDVAVMGIVGHAIAVADAFPECKAAAEYVTLSRGGRGAVREVCASILRLNEGCA